MEKQILGKYIIDIRDTEHATWQGSVLTPEEEKVPFRSVLELLELLKHDVNGNNNNNSQEMRGQKNEDQ